MSDLDALHAGIVADPHDALRWLIVADWLDDHNQPERAELLRLHRELIRTCCEPDQHPERAEWQARIVELIDQGVTPCVPQHTLMLPGGVPLVGAFIPPGSFLMGSEDGEDNEKPVHKVVLTKGFFIGVYPVTQEQWKAVKGANPSHFQGDKRPVESVDWEQVIEFCANVSALTTTDFRRPVDVGLPTEAEWECACRAGTTTRFHYGDIPDERRMYFDGYLDWYFGNIGETPEQTTEAGRFPSNPWGLFDCHGNVFEWCIDFHDDDFYVKSPTHDPVCQDEDNVYRVVRGGAYGIPPEGCRSARRGWDLPEERGRSFGFRVAFTLS